MFSIPNTHFNSKPPASTMKAVVVLLLSLSIAYAVPDTNRVACTDVTCSGSEPALLLYKQRPAGDVASQFSLECRPDGYTVTVSPVDQYERSAFSWFEYKGHGAAQNSSRVHIGKLTDLVGKRGDDSNCEADLGVTGSCKLTYSGSVKVREYIKVPGALQLHWFGFYDVDFSCTVETGSVNIDLINWEGPAEVFNSYQEICWGFEHTLTIFPNVVSLKQGTQAFSVNINAVVPQLTQGFDWRLKDCSLVPAVGSPLRFIADGYILNQPELIVSGVRRVNPTTYQLTLDPVAVPFATSTLDCSIQTCANAGGQYGCPAAGAMPRRTVSRGLGHTIRAEVLGQNSHVIVVGDVVLHPNFGNANEVCKVDKPNKLFF